jgi:alpha-L-rhamnosidase
MSQPGIVKAEFIFQRDRVSFESCHASTIAETQEYLVCAFFGGKAEGEPDVGIWLSRSNKMQGDWSNPVEVANGVQYKSVDSGRVKRYPCWNPVLYQAKNGPLLLFYKVGPDPPHWWGMLMASHDQGRTWSRPRRLPEGIIGPSRAKPVLLDNGWLLCGASTEHEGWRVHMEYTADLGNTWSRTKPLNDGRDFSAIQPTILTWPDDKIQILCRSDERILESWSTDGADTWSPLQPTVLPNPNAGIDALKLPDARHLLVYNHSTRKTGGRSRLNVAVTKDGKCWKAALKLEDSTTIGGQKASGAYPAAILASDGLVHITYTWKRLNINYVVVDPNRWWTPTNSDSRI